MIPRSRGHPGEATDGFPGGEAAVLLATVLWDAVTGRDTVTKAFARREPPPHTLQGLASKTAAPPNLGA
jgi:hypothetical protein